MQTKIAIAAGAAAVMSAVGAEVPAQAAPIPVAANYAELLKPVENAAQRLAADDAQRAQTAMVEQIQYREHHHHHHHGAYWYRTHGYIWFGNKWVLRSWWAHHHHHHHHHHRHDHMR